MKKTGIFLVLILIFASFAQMAQAARAREDSNYSKKIPVLAGGLSLLLPGIGQYYVGGSDNVTKGIICTVAYVGGWTLYIVSFVNAVGNLYSYPYTYKPATWDAGLGLLGLGIIIGDLVFSSIDALGDARSMNRAHGVPEKGGGWLAQQPAKQDPFALNFTPIAFTGLDGNVKTGPELSVRF